MTRLEQVLALADTATVRFGTWDVSVRNPPRDHPHGGWLLTVVDHAPPDAGRDLPPSKLTSAATWPVVLSALTFLGVSANADWQIGWSAEEGPIDLAPTRPLPRVR
jgi:hypothetical protein